ITPQTTVDMLTLVDQLNDDDTVDGILIQLPLPDHIESVQVLERIRPAKDVDGFHPVNLGKVLLGKSDAFYPCTPLGIKVLLEQYKIDLKGKHVVIVGRSNIVGKPLAAMLVQNAPGCNATVTVAHSYTQNLKEVTLSADVLVAAIGKPHFITADMVRPGAVVVDVGINKVEDPTKRSGFRLVGDVDYAHVLPKVQAITPVPGGVGPMTIAMLLQNTVKSFFVRL
ncbi:MAG: bifunctional 5,10-methylenetetrahydrofolate dehydrogenase/5,10-methenyltetrahydrofolate cyclohydrolase, partial [Verrucomicrobia bacterium]|nr:bifunctional 5,10-methylenetetrahydrofolate dehydrogenase/5,10-methenyltetrahydrofolate cyclohydrolase [Verrucomicrobiota bacterium]